MSKTVLEVYQHMMKRASALRKGDTYADANESMSLKEVGQEMASELYFFCGELEKTEEINPTKK